MQDSIEYEFMTLPHAALDCRLVGIPTSPELQLFGNRAGILSLANVLLWFRANAWRREFLAFGELPFARLEGKLSVSIRMSERSADDGHGYIRRLDQGESLEWEMTDNELLQVGLRVHNLASKPGHEYERLLIAEGSAFGVHLLMTDATEWLK